MSNQELISDLHKKIESSTEFMMQLRRSKYFFMPALEGVTKDGSKLELGFSCYGLKFFYLVDFWNELSDVEKYGWVAQINSYQRNHSIYPKNSFIDENYFNALTKSDFKDDLKYLIKLFINITRIRTYDTKRMFRKKSINAETKQAISTLFQIGSKNLREVEAEYDSDDRLLNYLNSLDWSQPWASGAQFSSLCVYSATQESYNPETLKNFSNDLVDIDSGFYNKGYSVSNRQMFNGAMKVISGLDWINHEIHYPEKIIDYCLTSKPIYEGCDIVDYIYVLNKCSKISNYRKKEVVNIMTRLSKEMNSLYHNNLGGYSYFENKSQTHYYGVKITEGLNTPDIHATLLCTWANIMILDTIEGLDGKYKTLKP